MYRMLSLLFAVVMAIHAMVYAPTPEETRLLNALDNGTLVRLHVIAASDSDEDQRIKLKVRDAIIAAFSAPLSQPDSPEDLLAEVHEQLDNLEKAATEVCLAEGYQGSVHAETGVFAFPDKTYGNVLVPQGEYSALRIVIGEGQGQNWWCVLYPALCLATAEVNDPVTAEGVHFTWHLPKIFSQWLPWGA